MQYDSNVNAPFSADEMVQLKEVYGASLEKEILSRPNRVLSMKNLLRNRIVIENRPDPKDQKNVPYYPKFLFLTPLFQLFKEILFLIHKNSIL